MIEPLLRKQAALAAAHAQLARLEAERIASTQAAAQAAAEAEAARRAFAEEAAYALPEGIERLTV